MNDERLLSRFLQEIPPFRIWGIERVTFRVDTLEAGILKSSPKVGGGIQSWTIGLNGIMEGFRPFVGLQPDAPRYGIGPEETDARTQEPQFFQAFQQRGAGIFAAKGLQLCQVGQEVACAPVSSNSDPYLVVHWLFTKPLAKRPGQVF